MRRFGFLVFIALIASFPLFAGNRNLTLDEILDPSGKLHFAGAPQSGFVWTDDAHFLWPRTDPDGKLVELVSVDAKKGTSTRVLDPATLEAALAKTGGVSAEDAEKIAHDESLTFSPDYKSILLTADDDLFAYTLASGKLTRLTDVAGEERNATFSPDGSEVAFVRDHDLHLVSVTGGAERALTSGGDENHLHGELDWVYQEEVYGRGDFNAFWWSPDGKSIAWLDLDETPVPRFTIVDHIPYHQTIEQQRYPKAGDPNPIARLMVLDVASGRSREVDTTKYPAKDRLIVDVSWTPDSRDVVVQVQNRLQTWLDLDLVDRTTGASKTILRETSPAWVEPQGSPRWIDDQTFLWLSERSGFRHLYRIRRDGTVVNRVTTGDWEVTKLDSVDAARKLVYFESTRRSSRDVDVERVNLDGTHLERLSSEPGRHSASFNPSSSMYLDRWGDLMTPLEVRLVRSNGRVVRVVDRNDVPLLGELALSRPEWVEIPTRDGFVMEGVIFKPEGFDPSRRYPVYEYVYGGPHAPMVVDRPQRRDSPRFWFHQFLTQHGWIVFIVDNRTASGKGARSAWPVWHHFGRLELRDLEDAVAWLKAKPWVDGSRFVLSGWSYGGFMTSYALTHSTAWTAGIAGGTVADWRDYDTIYTERYMGLPKDNAEGYHESSPRFAAKNLHGKLLLLHGLTDDNVHVQNTIQFAYELEKAGKDFRMMLYPKSRHHVGEPLLEKHVYLTMWRFLEDVGKQESSAGQP